MTRTNNNQQTRQQKKQERTMNNREEIRKWDAEMIRLWLIRTSISGSSAQEFRDFTEKERRLNRRTKEVNEWDPPHNKDRRLDVRSARGEEFEYYSRKSRLAMRTKMESFHEWEGLPHNKDRTVPIVVSEEDDESDRQEDGEDESLYGLRLLLEEEEEGEDEEESDRQGDGEDDEESLYGLRLLLEEEEEGEGKDEEESDRQGDGEDEDDLRCSDRASGGKDREVESVDPVAIYQELGSFFVNGRRMSHRTSHHGSFMNARGLRRSQRLRN